ncbi:hypothetical protein [Methylobacterium sp. WL6]|uniref:hypothetical protein n=1 Tax=Methylobacterium sp. WL6 TaxID=2603901 RepID=UPI0011CBCE90|nr:hypothetical protein [Methylobacterium sp. WL6]TXN72406.1 hypothetical protein FV230_05110 [Methylobacterium sp. WL6]
MEPVSDAPKPPVFSIKRGRLGNFQFSLETDHGRLNGVVRVAVAQGQSSTEIEDAAHRKIRALVEAFVTAEMTSR